MGSRFEKLGKYIVECDDRNVDNKYDLSALRGVSINKEFIESKANMDGVSLSPYKLVKPNEFCYVTITSRNGEKISLAQNTSHKTYIVSSSYIVFKIIDESLLLPDYLYLILSKPEFDRYARFNSWGSAREAFTFESMKLTEICVPSPEEQQKVVNAWKACREIKEQNEAKAAPLMQLCQSYIQELKHKYPAQEIGPYIEECNERNADGRYGVDELRGVTSEGIFDISKAKTDGLNFLPYKVVYKGDFAYNPSRINLGSIAMLDSRTFIISPMYVVFRLNKDIIIPEYLSLWFRRKEFQRSTLFYASGSVRDTFDFKEMKNVKIPLPPIDVQRAIVNIYKCANEAKQIAEEADKLSRAVCPALLQHVIHS